MTRLFKKWWDGTYISPENDPRSPLVIMMGHHEKHWTSKTAHIVVDFWLKYWQWCLGFGLAVVGLIWKH